MASLPDVNGDGENDILLGAPGVGGAGAAGLFLCPLQGALGLDDADRSYLGEEDDDALGVVSSAGDCDGDGYGDFLLGAPDAGDASDTRGVVYLFLGASSPAATVLSYEATIQGHYSGERLGHAIAGIGDFDADGRDDLLLGAPGRDWPEADAGGAYLFYGAVSGELDSGDADATLEGPAPGSAAGTALAAPGDINQDGFDDLLLGAPYGDLGQLALVFGQGW